MEIFLKEVFTMFKLVMKWILWGIIVLPVSFLLGALAGLGGQAWNLFILNALGLSDEE